ncbi:dipeptidase [Hyphococcus lacteus]|uniref:Dipeptidase n=1 Tax=Hyphococcus lacteus TaxID=3143536 RepID=A0ABV3Z4E7_9PROT
MKKIGLALVVLLVAAASIFYGVLPQRIDRKMNVVIPHDPYEISEAAQTLHDSIPVADLHSDMLLWRRNPAKENSRGHTDVPRLLAGGVALQVFTAVTKSPSGLNYEENDAATDDITMLTVVQAWPRRTWDSIYERAAYQAQRLDKLERDAPDAFVYVKSASDLNKALDRGVLAGVYGIEGAHPLEGELENIDRLYDLGLRIMGLQHFFDNELGGSLHGQSGAGLTDFGKAAVDRAIAKGMIIDVAHSSEQVVWDVLARTERPVIVSHTGMKGHCDTARNISDDLMKAIADAGGLVGIGFWDAAVCDASPAGIADALLYAVEHLGVDHVALGSDFDGTVTTPIDGSEMVALSQALLDKGADEATIRAVMGENAVRFFRANLPPR